MFVDLNIEWSSTRFKQIIVYFCSSPMFANDVSSMNNLYITVP